jgi:hypothetical protein
MENNRLSEISIIKNKYKKSVQVVCTFVKYYSTRIDFVVVEKCVLEFQRIFEHRKKCENKR